MSADAASESRPGTILAVRDGRLYCPSLPGAAADARAVLRPLSWLEYEVTPNALGGLESGIEIDLNAGRVAIKSSPTGLYPVSYFLAPGVLIVGASPAAVAAEMARIGRAVKPCRAALLASLLFDHAPGSQTYFEGVSKTEMGGLVTCDVRSGTATHDRWWNLALYSRKDCAYQTVFDEAADLMRGLFNAPPEEPVHLALSGGLDSRLMACFLARRPSAVRAFSYGSFGSADAGIARDVAGALGLPWRQLPLEPHHYLEYGDRIADDTGGLVTGMHMHLYSCADRLPGDPGCLALGYLGEHPAGDSARALRPAMTEENALREYVAGHAASNPVWAALPADDRERVESGVRDLLRDCCEVNPPCCLEEYIGCTTRQSALITYIFSVAEDRFRLYRPYATREYVDFFSSLPAEYRVGRKLFREVAHRLFPDIFSLRSTEQPLGTSVSPSLQRRYVRFRNALQYATMVVGRDRLPIAFSPYMYEQHAYLFRTALRARLDEAIARVQDFLALDLTALRQVPRRLRWAPTLFRIMAMDRVFCADRREAGGP